AGERGCGRSEPCPRLLGLEVAVTFEPEEANHERHGEALSDEGREDDTEGEVENDVAGRKGRAGIGGQRERESSSERDGASHARPGDERRVLPGRIRVTLADPATQK